jgi:hypothetical protein
MHSFSPQRQHKKPLGSGRSDCAPQRAHRYRPNNRTVSQKNVHGRWPGTAAIAPVAAVELAAELDPLGAADEALGDDQGAGAEWNRTTVRLTPSNGSGRADATREAST